MLTAEFVLAMDWGSNQYSSLYYCIVGQELGLRGLAASSVALDFSAQLVWSFYNISHRVYYSLDDLVCFSRARRLLSEFTADSLCQYIAPPHFLVRSPYHTPFTHPAAQRWLGS